MRFVLAVALVACGSDRPSCPALDDTTINAECTDGCTPAPLAAVGARTSNLVMTADAFAWLDHDGTVDRVMTVPHTGGLPTELAQLGRIANHATHLRTNGTRLAWNEGPTIYVDGSAVATSTAALSRTRYALDATMLYLPTDASLDAHALAGGALLASWPITPIDILPDAPGPLLANCGGTFRAHLADGRLERASLLSMCAVRIAKNSAYAFVNAYIASCDVSGLVRIDLATKETLLVVLDDEIGSIAADETHVYYVHPSGLYRVAIDGGKPARILEGTIDSFTLDDANMYVLAAAALVRIAK